jgi:hypothetical protein
LQPGPVILVKPGRLSLAAAYLTLVTAVFFLVNSPLFNGQGISGDWINVTYGIIIALWGVILLLFARRLMVDQVRHLIWGAAVVTSNALTGIFFVRMYGTQLLASSFLPQELTLTLMMIGPAVGVVGGLLGVFWKTSLKQGSAVHGLQGVTEDAT